MLTLYTRILTKTIHTDKWLGIHNSLTLTPHGAIFPRKFDLGGPNFYIYIFFWGGGVISWDTAPIISKRWSVSKIPEGDCSVQVKLSYVAQTAKKGNCAPEIFYVTNFSAPEIYYATIFHALAAHRYG